MVNIPDLRKLHSEVTEEHQGGALHLLLSGGNFVLLSVSYLYQRN